MTTQRDYYEVLGVDKNADAEERFKEISKAYGVLSDKKKRAEYDA